MMKKAVKIFVIIILSILLLSAILFVVFIANPFESDYHQKFWHLLPPSTDIAIYTSAPRNIKKNCEDFLPWHRVRSQCLAHQVDQTTLYRTITKNIPLAELQRNYQNLQKWGIDIPVLFDNLASREIMVAIRLIPNSMLCDYIVMSRISFKVKTAYGLKAFLPKSLCDRLQLKDENGIYSVMIPRLGKFYLMLQRDILFFSNEIKFLRDVQDILVSQKTALTKISARAQYLDGKDSSGILLYADGLHLDKFLQDDRRMAELHKTAQKLQLCPPQARYCSGEWRIEKNRIQFELDIPSGLTAAQPLHLPFTDSAAQPQQLPKSTVAFVSAKVPWLYLWQNIQRNMPRRAAREMRPYLQKLSKYQQGKDFINACCTEYLKPETLMALSRIDFSKENISAIDLYPAFTIMIRSDRGPLLLDAIRFTLRKIKEDTLEKEFAASTELYIEEKYAGHTFLRLKFFDVSGGAIRPAFGVIDGYFVITSHVSFLKTLMDVRDKIEPGIINNRSFKKFVADCPRTFWLDGAQGCKVAADLKAQIAKWIALQIPSRGRNFHIQKKEIEKGISELLEILDFFHLCCASKISLEEQEFRINLDFSLELK